MHYIKRTITAILSLLLLISCSGVINDTPSVNSMHPLHPKSFVGIYVQYPHAGYKIEVSEQAGRFYAQGTGQNKAELVKDSQLDFHIGSELFFEFNQSIDGNIESFVVEQNGQKSHFTKESILLKNSVNRKFFQNIYPSTFIGDGPHSKYDKVDYLKSTEKAYKSHTIVSRGKDDIDRTLGFDYHDFTVNTDFETLRTSKESSITWLGHASFLIKTGNGDTFLTDPVFGSFDGFLGWLSHLLFDEFERISPSVVSASDVDYVDGVLISHNHYDHFSPSTIEKLGNKIQYFVPLNFSDYFASSYDKITEMDWYNQQKLKNSIVHFVPAHHYSGRGAFDDQETLWGGWIIESNERKIYFSGDSGYTPIFKDIAKRYGPMDICLMAVAAYAYDGRDIHMAPEDALKAADELGCSTVIPWGYGTWATGYEHVLEPLRRLRHAMADNQYDFKIVELKMGESSKY